MNLQSFLHNVQDRISGLDHLREESIDASLVRVSHSDHIVEMAGLELSEVVLHLAVESRHHGVVGHGSETMTSEKSHA